MAAVGMKFATFAPVATEGVNTITYSTGVIAEHLMRGEVTYNYDEGSLYGDDMTAEYLKQVRDYDIEIELTQLDNNVSKLLGIEKETTGSGATVYHLVGDNTTAVGVGFLQVLIVDGVKHWRGYWFHKVVFSINSESATTRGESIEWQTPVLNGKGHIVLHDTAGVPLVRDRVDFTSEADGLAWLKAQAGITP